MKDGEKQVMMSTTPGVKVFHFNFMITCFVILGKLMFCALVFSFVKREKIFLEWLGEKTMRICSYTPHA